jgi:MYXO-CTERM domain-containing protein
VINGATIGVPYSYFVTATGIPAPTLSAGTLPGWLTFNPGTGELSGTPLSADFGLSAQIDITANNGWAPNAVQSFQIQVNGIAPVITSTAPTTAVAGTLYTYTIIATGDPAPTLGVAGNPAWLTLTGNVLSGTPAGGDVGLTGQITVTASNGELPDFDEIFQIDVSGVAPQITSTAPTSVVVGSLYTYTIVATGSPAPSVMALGLPAWLNLVGNVLSGTPAGTDVGVSGNITITATNGVAPDDTEIFQVTVNGTAPVFTSTPVTGAAINAAYSYTATATGLPTPTLSVSSTLPAWLSFNAGTGALTGTPTTADGGSSVSVTIVAANGVAPNATQTFTIGVAKPSDDSDDSSNCSGGTAGAGLGLTLPVLALVGFARRRRKLA